MEERFMCEVKGRLGGGSEDLQEAKLLRRVLRRTPGRWRREVDHRRAEKLLRGVLAPLYGMKPAPLA
eukprot:13986533-Alexandrium_andersonii.AAC.1